MSRIRIAYTAGAAIGPDLFRFYRSIGINLKQLYGSTETCAYVCLQPDGEIKFDSVGKAAPGVEVKIADNGEVLVRGAMAAQGILQTARTPRRSRLTAGLFPHRRRRRFRRRRPPENHRPRQGRRPPVDWRNVCAELHREQAQVLPHIKEAVCFGHQRDHVVAFINIDLTAVGNWAERRNMVYSGYIDLAGKDEVRPDQGLCREGQRRAGYRGELSRFADPALPGAAQGT